MREVFNLLILCSVLSVIYFYSCKTLIYRDCKGYRYEEKKETRGSKIVFFLILFIMILFAGLRTTMNDTTVYLANFEDKIPNTLTGIKEIDWTIGTNPMFKIYQIIIKSLISESGTSFLFITSCIVVGSYLFFLRKYSCNFGYSVFILISFTVYAFTMAAMKQTLAIAIAIWSIPCAFKGNRIQAIVIIIIAMLIHPYVVIFFAQFLLEDDIWDKRTVFLIVLTIFCSAFFNTFVSNLISLTASISDEYSLEWFMDGGVSLFRLSVYLVVPILSFLWRKNIRKNADRFSFLTINLSIISACFMVLASFGGANMFGRMANYFDIFQCMALPVVLRYGFVNVKIKNVTIFFSVLCFCVFYYTYYAKYVSLGECFYNHISVFELMRNW